MSSASAGGANCTERAHAKINLLLRILARDASGYHGIETLFQRLALHDVVHVAVGDLPRQLRCAGPAMPLAGLGAPHENLAWRAAAVYLAHSGWATGFQIDIEKQIPVGGGLGGGSADAAAVLRALERLSPAPIGMARLLEIAGTLGADVPFLVSGASRAWAWGRGDRLLLLAPLPPMDVTLLTFATGVNTGMAYRAFAAARDAEDTRRAAGGAFAYSAAAFDSWASIVHHSANDFEDVVMSLHDGVCAVLPKVRACAAELRANDVPAAGLMSGSGATCLVLAPPGTAVVMEVPVGVTRAQTQTY